MGFKADTSFLRFLTMGAVGVRATIDHLRTRGFEPIELERYSTSNKIWATKIKRLRLPDLLCLKTGVRIEVRAKSELKIRMSDAPNNPERRWDAGLRPQDLIAFVVCEDVKGLHRAQGDPTFFRVSDMSESVSETRLGSPKSASDGAERDREWLSTVPKQDGIVLEVTPELVRTQLASGRRQTYQLRSKNAYVGPGSAFHGGLTIIASVVQCPVDMDALLTERWNPEALLGAPEPIDRYTAAKALAHGDNGTRARDLLELCMVDEEESRVKLEMAASAAHLGSNLGLESVVNTIWDVEKGDLRMEAVLILAEVGSVEAARELLRVAESEDFRGDELREAAVWCLGKAGTKSYSNLLGFISDGEDSVAMHAIAAFGADLPGDVVDVLVKQLQTSRDRDCAAASAVLRLAASRQVAEALVGAITRTEGASPWLVATLGRLPTPLVLETLGHPTQRAGATRVMEANQRRREITLQLQPLQVLSEDRNWLESDEASQDMRFLVLQDL